MGGLILYLKGLMADPHGCPSSKRLIVFVCAILMVVGYIANLFWQFTVDEFMFNAVMYVIIGGMGITGVEKFAPTKVSTTNDSN